MPGAAMFRVLRNVVISHGGSTHRIRGGDHSLPADVGELLIGHGVAVRIEPDTMKANPAPPAPAVGDVVAGEEDDPALEAEGAADEAPAERPDPQPVKQQDNRPARKRRQARR